MKVKNVNPLMKIVYLPVGILSAFMRRSYIIFMNSYYHSKYGLDRSVRIRHECLLYGDISIGEGTYLQRNCSLTGIVTIGKDCAIASGVNIRAMLHTKWEGYDKEITQEIIIGDNVVIGVNTFIKEGITIGDNVIIGANSSVIKDLPSNCTAVGSPARIIK